MKAKTKIKRLWSILLSLAMLVGLLPTVVLAAESTATADFSADPTAALAMLNAAKTGETDSTWDAYSKTLTLNGVNFESSAETAVKLPEDAIIVLSDGTTNTINGGDSDSGSCYGIYANSVLTIKGSGTLNVTAGKANNLSYGIYAYVSVSINGGTVTATGDTAGNQSFGIYALNNNVTINGGNVKAIGGEGKASSNGLWAGNGSVTINGGIVKAIGGSVTAGTSSGIYAKNVDIATDNGTPNVTAIGGKALGWSSNSYGIYAYKGSVSINGGTVTAASDSSYVYKGDVTISDGTGSGFHTITFDANGGTGLMEAVTNEATYTLPENGFTAPEGKRLKGWAKSADGEVISDESIEVTEDTTLYAIWELRIADFSADPTAALAMLNAAKTGETDSTWDADSKTLTLNGVNYKTTAETALKLPDGAIIVLADDTTNTIAGGDSDLKDCYGIYANGVLTIEGTGTLNVTAGKANNLSYGIYAYDSVSINGGTVTATGGEATNGSSCGIGAGGSVNISGGNLIAKAEDKALNKAPNTLPDTYWWRAGDSSVYTAFPDTPYEWVDGDNYLEIRDMNPDVHNFHLDYTPLRSISSQTTLESKKYFLDGDISITDGSWYKSNSDTTVCLNGQTLTGSYVPAPIFHTDDSTDNLTLCDCTGRGVITAPAGRGSSAYGTSAVLIQGNGIVNMTSGNILNVYTKGGHGGCGAGAWIDQGTFNMSGGTIIGCVSHYNNGGGVYVGSSGTFNVSGAPVIKDNYACGGTGSHIHDANCKKSDVYLCSNKVINLVDALTDGAQIGVTCAVAPTAGNPVVITSGYSDFCTENPSKFFFSNDENYEVRWNRTHTEAALYLKSDPPVEFSVTINGLSETVTLNDVYDGTTIIVAFYKDNAELVDVKTYQPQPIINAEHPNEADSYAYTKVFWWESLDTLRPLCDAVTINK